MKNHQFLPSETHVKFIHTCRVITADGTVTMELEWSKPTQTFGDLRGYRLKFGPKNGQLEEILLEGGQVLQHKIQKLGTRGTRNYFNNML